MKNMNRQILSVFEDMAKQNVGISYFRKIAVVVTLLMMDVACQDNYLSNSKTSASTDPTLSQTSTSSATSLPHTNNTDLIMPISISSVLTTYYCSHNPGSNITFEGAAGTTGFDVRRIFGE